MRDKRTAGRWVGAALAAATVLTSGCAAPVDPDTLPGVYRNDETGGELVLASDRTFSATDVSTDDSPDTDDFSGSWDVVERETADDFVYLAIEDGTLGRIGGIQLYTGSPGTVYFRYDPDGPPSLILTRTTAS
ncbi:hypothetical protein RM572_07155 [Streptomyces sp. DSM 42041]|uniref:Uncharacterized protein n=1 Tax=Streptomyces hazeniae TaxID=3075538 RepID=A0ABU2NNK1_9ACTN|nr:hypothetical protein [Streptomyces sp. DSM 42041]MDT0378555.1 hypothetical protein [Streptomyces sp. DSM 42041]